MTLETSDKVKIAYDWYPAEKPAGYLLLIHMMPATKDSWRGFAGEMQRAGYASLAIDLRGHGESDGGPEGYKNFSDAEHQKSIWDLDAGVKFLIEQGAKPDRITLIGASIGANLALWYLVEHPQIKCAVLLSAGENYRGIAAVPFAKKLSLGQRLLLIASRDDVRSGGDVASFNEEFAKSVPAKAEAKLIIYETGGHGTELLGEATPEIKKFIVDLL